MPRVTGHRLLQRGLVGLLVLALASVGLMIRGGPRKDERHPCESCRCGCGSAVECWTNCCCFSPTERARWALVNDVPIPIWATDARRAAESLRASLEPGVDLAEVPACCRGRLLGCVPARAVDPATCKGKPKVGHGAPVLLVLDLRPAPAFHQPLVGWLRPERARWPATIAPEPREPPPRAVPVAEESAPPRTIAVPA